MAKYQEAPLFVGTDQQQEIPELKTTLFLNKETNSYTIALISTKQNRFCIVSTGNGMLVPEKSFNR